MSFEFLSRHQRVTGCHEEALEYDDQDVRCGVYIELLVRLDGEIST